MDDLRSGTVRFRTPASRIRKRVSVAWKPYRLRGSAPIYSAMLWFFARHDSRLHYEIRRQTDSEDFEIVISHPDGRQDVERYADAKKLLNRSIELQNALKAQGWQPLG